MGIKKGLFLRMVHHVSQSCLIPDSQSYHDDGGKQGCKGKPGDGMLAERSTGVTVFVTTHYMDEAEYCDRVSVMVDGRIEALGSPAELKGRYEAKDMDEVFTKIAGRR